MDPATAPSWAAGFEEPVEDRHALAAAAARWFAPLAPPADGSKPRPAAASDDRPTDRLIPVIDSAGDPVEVSRSLAVEISAIWLLLRLVSLPDVADLRPPLTGREFASLHLLRTTGPLRVIDIGDLLQMDKSTTSRVVRALLDRGLLERARHPTDGRAFLVELSAGGRSVIADAVASAGFTLGAVLATWDATSRAALLDGLLRLRSEWTALLPHRWAGNATGAWDD